MQEHTEEATIKGKQSHSSPQDQSQPESSSEQEYDLTEISLTAASMEPIKIDGMKQIMKLLHSGTVKGIENPKVREKFVKSITLERVGKVMRLSFYFILVSNFPECVQFDEEKQVVEELKRKMGKNYVKLFSVLPQPKDELVNMIIFCIGYANHFLFYQLFPKQRELFDLRFVFNCYHILIFAFNGIFVSDFFVRMNIDKIFHQNKFLDYERVNKKNLLLQQQAKKKTRVKTFFGYTLPFPEVSTSDGQTFNKQIQEKFKPAKKNVHLQDDHLTDHISNQEKQIKIHATLKHKRMKQIEEKELEKLEQQLSHNHKDNNNNNQDNSNSNDPQHHEDTGSGTHRRSSHAMAVKIAMERAEEIFDKTALHHDDEQNKEEQNFFSNLQLNCNQISTSISDVLAYDSRTLPFEKKKMIRHTFETVNDKEDNLLAQLKQFSNQRKQKKESKSTSRVNKSIIDHFGLRPPPREYYQKHPKLDKLFKDILDINYVLQCNQESMNQLPSSVAMHSEQANQWLQLIADQESNYNKTNQRQKVQDNLREVVSTNQKYQLEKRPGYRKKYIYTKPLQYMQKTQSVFSIPQDKTSAEMNINGKVVPQKVTETTKMTKTKKQDDPAFILNSMMNVTLPNLIGNSTNVTADKSKNLNSSHFPQIDSSNFGLDRAGNNISAPNLPGSSNQMTSPMKIPDKGVNYGTSSKVIMQEENKAAKRSGGMKYNEMESSGGNRTFEFKVVEMDTKGNKQHQGSYEDQDYSSQQQQFQKQQGGSEFYNDKRRFYKDKYKGFINGMSTDNNIDDILQDILHQRNQFNKGLKGKLKNL